MKNNSVPDKIRVEGILWAKRWCGGMSEVARGSPARPRVGSRLAPPLGALGTSLGLLRCLSPFRVKIDVREFLALSENISFRTFLK